MYIQSWYKNRYFLVDKLVISSFFGKLASVRYSYVESTVNDLIDSRGIYLILGIQRAEGYFGVIVMGAFIREGCLNTNLIA